MEKVLVIGAAIVDIYLEVDRFPQTGEAPLPSPNKRIHVGGCAFNVASVLQYHRVPVSLFVPVGQGEHAERIKKVLTQNRLPGFFQIPGADNGYCSGYLRPDGGYLPLEDRKGIEWDFQAEWFQNINPADYTKVYLSGYELEAPGGEHFVRFGGQNPSLTIFFAPGPRINDIPKERMERLLALSPILHLNEMEARRYTGEKKIEQAARQLYTATKKPVIVTLDRRGAYAQDRNAGFFVRGCPVKAVNTLGAGDSHLGGLIAGLARGRDLRAAIALGNETAANVVRHSGTLSDRLQKTRIYNREEHQAPHYDPV